MRHSKTKACISEINEIFVLACVIQEIKSYITSVLKSCNKKRNNMKI